MFIQFNVCRYQILLCLICCTTLIVAANDKLKLNETEKQQQDGDNGVEHALQPTALPLSGNIKTLRHRRQHPSYTIVKHVLRTTKRTKPRHRVKRPKIKYGPPHYNYGEPISHYKPSYAPVEEHSSDIAGQSIFPSIDHFKGLHIEGTDFELPPSSYEAQSMDLDFYNHKPAAPSYSSYAKHYEPQEPITDDYQPPYESLETLTSVNDDYEKGKTYYPSSSSYEPLSPPATKYGVPVEFNPSAVLPPAYHAPNFDQNPYALYEKRIPNTGYPQGPHQQSDSYENDAGSHVEITYSPSYEINIPENPYAGNFAEPPVQPVEYAHAQHEYAVEPSTRHRVTTAHHQEESESEDSTRYLRPTPGLPINGQHNRPTYDYPKTSYEVPIYDSVPFDASHHDEHYPPHTARTTTTTRQVESQTTSSERPTIRSRPHKRNRVRGTTSTATATVASSNKHILDVPELQQAFEANNRQLAVRQSDADVNESNQVEERQGRLPFDTNYVWDPMRLRTTMSTSTSTSTSISTTTSTATTKTTKSSDSSNVVQKRRKNYIHRRPLMALRARANIASAPNASRNGISIISIEKSHSRSYYDGTMSPPTPKIILPTTTTTDNTNTTKRTTTNGNFDTTVFKSPRNTFTNYVINPDNYQNHERQFNDNLPKNHKYF